MIHGQIGRLGVADIRQTYSWYTADIRPDRRPKTDSKFFIMSWTCGRCIRLICGWLTYTEYTADIRLKNDSKIIIIIIIRISTFRMATEISIFGRISGVYQPYIGRISAIYQPYVSCILAACKCQSGNSRMLHVCRMSAVHPPYVHRT